MVIFIMPILQLVLLGYATNTDVRNVPTIVYGQDNSRASRELLDAYKATGYFSLDMVATSNHLLLRRTGESSARECGLRGPLNLTADNHRQKWRLISLQ